jgi:hypothetical protein
MAASIDFRVADLKVADRHHAEGQRPRRFDQSVFGRRTLPTEIPRPARRITVHLNGPWGLDLISQDLNDIAAGVPLRSR